MAVRVYARDDQFIATNTSTEAFLLVVDDEILPENNKFSLEVFEAVSIHPDAAKLESTPCTRLQLKETVTGCGTYNRDKTLFAGADATRDVYLWNVESLTGQPLLELEVLFSAGEFVFNADETKLAFAVHECLMNGMCVTSFIEIWDLTTMTYLIEIRTEPVRQLVFDLESQMLVAVTDQLVEFYHVSTGELVRSIAANNSAPSRVAFSDDASLFFIRYADNTIDVWGVPTTEG